MTASERKRAAADRARAYRQRQRDAARPSARVVDQAICEAVSFAIADARAFGMPVGQGKVDVLTIVKTARQCLTREGYDRKLSSEAVLARLRARPEHKQSDFVPSLKPHPDPSARLPDRVSPRGPRPDCRQPKPAAGPVDLAAQRDADLEWFFDGISEPAE